MPEINGPRDAPEERTPGPGARGRQAYRLRTRVVHAGEDVASPARPLTDPIAPSTVYAFHDPALAELWAAPDRPEAAYGRDGLPNVRALERVVAELEGAEDAHAAASGMAVIALTFLAHLASGDRVLASDDCYCDSRSLLSHELARFGVEATFVDAADLGVVAAQLNLPTRLVYVETISNPAMKLVDLPRVADLAHAAGALLCVDNTFATPLLCRPLEHGADLVVHSATKFLGGHHDLTAGVVVGRRELIAPIRRCGYRFGPTLGPLDAWLALRGIKTLAPRMAWISDSAASVAAFLHSHPAVACVRYPGLPDHPQAELAQRLLLHGAGGMLCLDLAEGPAAADSFLRSLRLIPFAPSLGGPTTTVCYPPRDLAAAPRRDIRNHRCATLRLSIGLEAVSDLVRDLAQALDAPAPAGAVRGEHRSWGTS